MKFDMHTEVYLNYVDHIKNKNKVSIHVAKNEPGLK